MRSGSFPEPLRIWQSEWMGRLLRKHSLAQVDLIIQLKETYIAKLPQKHFNYSLIVLPALKNQFQISRFFFYNSFVL